MPTLTWSSGTPNGTEYQPIRNMPGWRNFKQNFFAIADTLVCVPQSYNIARFMIQIRGRAVVTVDDKKVASMVRCSWLPGVLVKSMLCACIADLCIMQHSEKGQYSENCS